MDQECCVCIYSASGSYSPSCLFYFLLFPPLHSIVTHNVFHTILFHSIIQSAIPSHLLPFIFILFYSIPLVKVDLTLPPLWLVISSNILIGLKVGMNIGRIPECGGPVYDHPLRFTNTHKSRPLSRLKSSLSNKHRSAIPSG